MSVFIIVIILSIIIIIIITVNIMCHVCVFTVVFLGTKLIPFFGSTNIDGVVDAYCHALFAVRPRRRYVVGLDAMLIQFVALLPSAILDLMFLSPVLRAVPASCRQ